MKADSMRKMNILVLELVAELVKVTPDDFQRYRLMFLSSAGNPRLKELVHVIFNVAALRRPELIEMKKD